MAFIRGFARFWYDFIVGDDWKIAVAVVATLLVAAALVVGSVLPTLMLTPLAGVLLMLAFAIALVIDTRR
ncbi:hypothetical protein ABGB16_27285 [Micromonospora sp. B11E3]|uniref:hypothetical protein n=1 Tax=Micromonospora sp. B11E3 TaxID=3153562 RepID=UPI00325EEF71